MISSFEEPFLAMYIALAVASAPVSYTHLDVYKRQSYSIADLGAKYNYYYRSMFLSSSFDFAISIIFSNDCANLSSSSVSYTHLDVYKRQDHCA